jgi:hypothetical protein
MRKLKISSHAEHHVALSAAVCGHCAHSSKELWCADRLNEYIIARRPSTRVVRSTCFVETSPYSSIQLELRETRSPNLAIQQRQSVNYDFLVIGSGIAGLTYALKVAEHGSVAVITKESLSEGCTVYAQGGVCAVLDPLDSVHDHVQDTMVAGNFLNDERCVLACPVQQFTHSSGTFNK